MAKVTKAAKKAAIQALLDKSDEAVRRAITTIYNRQTASEKSCHATTNDNGVGFSMADAEFGSSLGSKIAKGWTLTPRQLECGRKMIKRYWAQLVEVADQKNPGWADSAEEKAAVAQANEEQAAMEQIEQYKAEMIQVVPVEVATRPSYRDTQDDQEDESDDFGAQFEGEPREKMLAEMGF